jgi:arylsulfatase A-like enzyme
LIKLYDGEITFWDQHFGRLLDELKRRGLYDGATIVVTSDHGEELAEHGSFWHGTTLYDEQTRVPLLLKLPGNQQAGSAVSHWVESIDVMPTLLRQAGIAVPAGVQGKDLFTGSSQVYAEQNLDGNLLSSLRYREEGAELKVITANPQNPRGLKPLELYRVDIDPGEQKDLSATESQQAERGWRELEQCSAQAKRGAVQRRSVQMTEQQKERLRRLGYLVE